MTKFKAPAAGSPKRNGLMKAVQWNRVQIKPVANDIRFCYQTHRLKNRGFNIVLASSRANNLNPAGPNITRRGVLK